MLTAAVPKLPFIDRQLTLDFYTHLGFTLDADYGDYLIMHLDQAELHFFSHCKLDPKKSDFMIYLQVSEGIETFLEKIDPTQLPSANFGRIETKPWGQRELSLLDPNGTLLTFGQAV